MFDVKTIHLPFYKENSYTVLKCILGQIHELNYSAWENIALGRSRCDVLLAYVPKNEYPYDCDINVLNYINSTLNYLLHKLLTNEDLSILKKQNYQNLNCVFFGDIFPKEISAADVFLVSDVLESEAMHF